MLATALIMAVALVGSPAGGEPDGVVATAPRTPVDLDPAFAPDAPSLAGATQEAAPHGLTTGQQIDRWLDARNPDVRPFDDSAETGPERRLHTEFAAGIGTGGFRHYGAAVAVPLGERGWLGLSYEQSENGYRDWGYGPGDPPPHWFNDSGYVFPGGSDRARAWEHERRIRRPGGPPTIGTLSTPSAVE